jgi:hypothetical protein
LRGGTTEPLASDDFYCSEGAAGKRTRHGAGTRVKAWVLTMVVTAIMEL